jgi:hypothetical protein
MKEDRTRPRMMMPATMAIRIRADLEFEVTGVVSYR